MLLVSCVTKDTTPAMKRDVHDGNSQVIFFNPQLLMVWRRVLYFEHYKSNLVTFVVDEAYCVLKINGKLVYTYNLA